MHLREKTNSKPNPHHPLPKVSIGVLRDSHTANDHNWRSEEQSSRKKSRCGRNRTDTRAEHFGENIDRENQLNPKPSGESSQLVRAKWLTSNQPQYDHKDS